MAPAIEIAERGYLVPVVVQQKWAAATAELQHQPGFAQTFLPSGRAPEVGELFRFPAAARALRAIARTGGRDFYEGEIAAAIAGFVQQHSGALSARGLAGDRPGGVAPIEQHYPGDTPPPIPPNQQGT